MTKTSETPAPPQPTEQPLELKYTVTVRTFGKTDKVRDDIGRALAVPYPIAGKIHDGRCCHRAALFDKLAWPGLRHACACAFSLSFFDGVSYPKTGMPAQAHTHTAGK